MTVELLPHRPTTDTCSVYDCRRSALPITSCGRSLCVDHSVSDWHPCLLLPEEQRVHHGTCHDNDVAFGLVAKIVDAPIIPSALSLRPAARFATLQPPRFRLKGKKWSFRGSNSLNLCMRVVFDDGVAWVARFRLPVHFPDDAASILVSAYATISNLNRFAPELVPMAWLPPQFPGLYYMFQEEVIGRAHNPARLSGSPRATPLLANVVDSVAQFFVKVSAHPFQGIGALNLAHTQPNPSYYSAGPLCEKSIRSLLKGGPYQTNQERHLARINDYLAKLEDTAPATVKNRIACYLSALETRELVQGCDEMARTGPTFIKHADDDAQNLFNNGTAALAAIIDWEFARLVPLEEAFIAPRAFVNLPDMEAGDNTLTLAEEMLMDRLEDLGRLDLSDVVRNGRKYHRLQRLGSWPNGTVDLGYVWGMRTAFLGDAAGDKPESFHAWYTAAIEKWGAHPDFVRLTDDMVSRARHTIAQVKEPLNRVTEFTQMVAHMTGDTKEESAYVLRGWKIVGSCERRLKRMQGRVAELVEAIDPMMRVLDEKYAEPDDPYWEDPLFPMKELFDKLDEQCYHAGVALKDRVAALRTQLLRIKALKMDTDSGNSRESTCA